MAAESKILWKGLLIMELKTLLQNIYKRLWIVVIAVLTCTISTTVLSYKVMKKEYEASATVYVLTQEGIEGQYIFTELLAGLSLINDYKTLINEPLIAQKIKDELQDEVPWVKKASVATIASAISIKSISESRVVHINASNANPEIAAKLANAAAEVFKEEASSLIKIENVAIIYRADVPKTPYKPKRLNIIGMGFAVGLISGFGIIYAIEFMEGIVKDRGSAGKRLESSVLDIVVEAKGVSPGSDGTAPFGNINPGFLLPEKYRLLRSNIRSLITKDTVKTIMVASCDEDEGNEEIIANLSIAFSQAGERVLLIDADLRKPVMHTLFGMQNELGLANIFEEGRSFKECVITTGINNFHLIPSGLGAFSACQLLDSKDMKEFIECAREQYDLILLTVASIRSTSDAVVLSSAVDGIIITAALGKTRLKALQEAEKVFKTVKANIICVLFNRPEPVKNRKANFGFRLFKKKETNKLTA